MSNHRDKSEGGFVLAEMLVALFVLTVCGLGLWTVAEQMQENRREREIHLEALMVAQQSMEAMHGAGCRTWEQQVTGRWATFRVRMEGQPLTPEWIWCQSSVTWKEGRRTDEGIVQLGKLVPVFQPALTE